MKRRVYRRRRRRNRKKLSELDEILQIVAILALIPFLAFFLSSGSRNDGRISHSKSEKTKSAEKYANPLPGYVYKKLHHDGRIRAIDIPAPEGEAIGAMSDGWIIWSDNEGRCGEGVVIRDVYGNEVRYCHMIERKPSQRLPLGTYVKQRDIIGRVGLTGHTNGYHLHIEFERIGDKTILQKMPWLEWKKQRKT